jgi:hypothetical protein
MIEKSLPSVLGPLRDQCGLTPGLGPPDVSKCRPETPLGKICHKVGHVKRNPERCIRTETYVVAGRVTVQNFKPPETICPESLLWRARRIAFRATRKLSVTFLRKKSVALILLIVCSEVSEGFLIESESAQSLHFFLPSRRRSKSLGIIRDDAPITSWTKKVYKNRKWEEQLSRIVLF